jgi:hypothetical protein
MRTKGEKIIIVEMQFGSHVYGTNVATSDTDYKGICIPSGEDILLQKIVRNTTTSTSGRDQKNAKDDIDREIFSYSEYLKMLSTGQTVTLDMIFTPEEFWISHTDDWLELVQNRDRLISSRMAGFVGYCKSQAAKYSIKGDRLAALKSLLDILAKYKAEDKLYTVTEFQGANDKLQALIEEGAKLPRVEMGPYTYLTGLPDNRGKLSPYIECCDKKIVCKLRVSDAIDLFKKCYDRYGHRAQTAMSYSGADWKALMHAVRVAEEAKEVLTTGQITFPRPEAKLLLKIRKGELPYEEVSVMIESRVQEVENLEGQSVIRSKPDSEFMKELVIAKHMRQVLDIRNR